MHYAMGLEKVDQIAKILVKGGARKPQDFVSSVMLQQICSAREQLRVLSRLRETQMVHLDNVFSFIFSFCREVAFRLTTSSTKTRLKH